MKRLTLIAALLCASAAAFAQTDVPRFPYMSLGSANNPLSWKMKKTKWSDQDEAEFGLFVQRIGTAVETKKCNNFVSCLTNPAINPFIKSDPQGIRYFADCADVPYWLRTYFAWKKGLPMSITTNTQARDPYDAKADNRNMTVSGNMVTQRADSVAINGKFPLVTQFLSSPQEDGLILDSVSSGTLRIPVIPDPSEPLADFYPIAINRSSIHPGTVIYTADGHVAIVYKIDEDGNIRTLNGHPADKNASNTPLGIRDYNDTFKRSRQEHGSIFKNFRPLQLVGAQSDSQGNLIGGQIVLLANSQIVPSEHIAKPSIEQAQLKFSSTSEYFMFVRKRMSNGSLKMNVITEFKRNLKNVCDTVLGRAPLVNEALANGMDSKTMYVGPQNIFSDRDDWENYSTPSRDVNIRVLFKKTLDDLQSSVNGLKAGDKTYVYSGANLKADLSAAYKEKVLSCTVSYQSRSGATKKLNLEQVHMNMFKMSFDPYHCADLRWGDVATGSQYCTEDMRWYNAEGYLRKLTEKNSDNHALTVDQMEMQNAAKSAAPVPNSDIAAYIKSLQ